MIIVPEEVPHFWKDLAAVTAVLAQVITIVAGVLILKNNL